MKDVSEQKKKSAPEAKGATAVRKFHTHSIPLDMEDIARDWEKPVVDAGIAAKASVIVRVGMLDLGAGTACEKFGDLETMRQAYEEWPLFSTFIDNIEMSIAKTDERIARMYLALGDREDLNEKVLNEMELTRKWVLAIVGDKWPLQHRHVLGQAIRIRSPYVDALSVTQVLALKSLRKKVDKEELSQSQQAGFIYLILCTVSGVAAGLQNTG